MNKRETTRLWIAATFSKNYVVVDGLDDEFWSFVYEYFTIY